MKIQLSMQLKQFEEENKKLKLDNKNLKLELENKDNNETIIIDINDNVENI